MTLGGCSSKSAPTAPTGGGPGVPPSGGTGSGTWNITVTATPNTLELPEVGETADTSTIAITVRNASTGAAPPNGTTIVVTAVGGTLSGAALCSVASSALCPILVGGQAQLTFTPTAAGTAEVRAQLEQSLGRAFISVADVVDPGVFTLNHADPNSGDPSGGYRVTIFGQNFEAPIRVLFGASTAQVVSVSPTRAVVVAPPLTTALPAGSTLPVNITVPSASGSTHESSDTLVNGFIYANGGSIETPVIFSVTPTTGPQEGGTPIVISGSHFQLESQVIFRLAGPGGTIDLEAPTDFAGSGRLESLTPDIRSYIQAGTLNSPFNAQIRVINPNGAVAVFAGQFTYGSTIRITSVGPGTGPFTGGTQVTIFGSGFDEPVAVSLGGIGQQGGSGSGTEVVFVTRALTGSAIPACGGQTAPLTVTVTNIEGGASASGGGFVYTGPPNPAIFNINPTGANVGTNVTINGQNFDTSALRVVFGGADGASAPIVSSSSTVIVATVPTPPPSFVFNTQACDANGDNLANGTRDVPTPISITVRNLVTGCESTLTNAFTLNPPSTACVNDVNPTPAPAANFSFAVSGLTANFTDTSTGGPTSWSWSFGDSGTSTVQNPSHVYAIAGTYTVTLVATNAGGSSSVSKSVTVP